MRCISVKLSIVVAVDRDDQVAGLEAGRRGGAAGLHRVDPRAHASACRRA